MLYGESTQSYYPCFLIRLEPQNAAPVGCICTLSMRVVLTFCSSGRSHEMGSSNVTIVCFHVETPLRIEQMNAFKTSICSCSSHYPGYPRLSSYTQRVLLSVSCFTRALITSSGARGYKRSTKEQGNHTKHDMFFSFFSMVFKLLSQNVLFCLYCSWFSNS